MRKIMRVRLAAAALLLATIVPQALGQNNARGQNTAEALRTRADQLAAAVEEEVIAWRRYLHAKPELSNREYATERYIAARLVEFGIPIDTSIAFTGVVGLLEGGKPGPVVALRADMDGLPVAEVTDVPFASKQRGRYQGLDVGVMHACGHDAHMAILLGTAKVLSQMRAELPGTVKFIFQPAEEGAPEGEEGGAELMVKQGVLTDPRPEAIFGLHVFGGMHAGKVKYRPGPTMAAVDYLRITLHGRQTHGAKPWGGIDPIVITAQVILGLQTIASRQVDVTNEPSIITIGKIDGGVRNNIIPDSVQMQGTIRTFDEAMRDDIHRRIRRTAENIAEASGARAEVYIRKQYPVTFNHLALTEAMVPTLARVAGEEAVSITPKITGAEDFSFFQREIPGFYFFLGCTPPEVPEADAAPNHSPRFYVDESCLLLGVRCFCHLTIDYLTQNP